MQETSVMEALARLEKIIERKKSYCEKNNISFVKSELKELEFIFKTLSQKKLYYLAFDMDKDITELQKKDTETNGVIISIRFRPGTERFSFIEKDLTNP